MERAPIAVNRNRSAFHKPSSAQPKQQLLSNQPFTPAHTEVVQPSRLTAIGARSTTNPSSAQPKQQLLFNQQLTPAHTTLRSRAG